MDERVKTAPPTLRHALGAVASTAVDQARDLVVAQLDRIAERLCEHLEAAAEEQPAPDLVTRPLFVGAIAGVAVAWLLAGLPPKT